MHIDLIEKGNIRFHQSVCYNCLGYPPQTSIWWT